MKSTAEICQEVFLACVRAMDHQIPIHRTSSTEKEFHFQNWFAQRLSEASILFDLPKRNSFPDFAITNFPVGFEVKGLAMPGRELTFDANSQVPTGLHGERTIYYVFGRYPATATGNDFPVLDLVFCHGDFLNAHHDYRHKNSSFRGFGSYGDIIIRDRKMYVAPTPFALTSGMSEQRTLILPAEDATDSRLIAVGRLDRVETDRLVAGYEFDLLTNELTPRYIENPDAGRIHSFVAFRTASGDRPSVSLREAPISSG